MSLDHIRTKGEVCTIKHVYNREEDTDYGHVEFQIKANDTCSNMVANSLPTDIPSTPGSRSKDQTIHFF